MINIFYPRYLEKNHHRLFYKRVRVILKHH